MEASDRSFRFTLLFFNCMLTFGSYFCFDMPSVLQAQFTGVTNCTANSTKYNESCVVCDGCLGMSNSDYNLLYAIYAWTNAVVVIGAGFLIDKLGNRIGLFLFSLLCVLGSSTFAAGVFFQGTSAMLPIMLIGRLLFGSGNGSLTIVQNRITAYWFRNKELALAFGITLAFSRLGSVLNFFLTQIFEDAFGLKWTLWAGAILCGLGFISSFIVSFMDIYGVRQLGDEQNLQSESKKLKVTDIKHFSGSYWLLALTIMFFYNGVFPFVADASDFIYEKYDEKYHFSKRTSSILAGAVYDVSMILSPFLGGLIDVIGKRGMLALLCALLTIPVFGILAFTYVCPLVATLWLGITYSFAAASMWPSIPLVVSQATVGTAMGLTTSIQMIGIGISNLVVGNILGKSQHIHLFLSLMKYGVTLCNLERRYNLCLIAWVILSRKNLASISFVILFIVALSRDETLLRWKYVMIFLLANSLACVATTTFLNINDKRKGGILNLSREQKRLRLEAQIAVEDNERSPLLKDKHTIN